MNSFFRQLPLPAKLMLIAVLPLVFLIYLAFQLYHEKAEKISVLDSYQKRIKRSSAISVLVDELQTERRFTFGYVVKKDWQSQMLLQRPKTDEAFTRLQDTTDETIRGFESYTLLNNLSSMRHRVDKNLIEPEEVMNYYTNAIFRLNNLNNISAGTIIYLKPISKELAGQKLLSEMITYMGILRASLYHGLFKRTPSAQLVPALRGLYEIYNTFQTEFLIKSSSASVYQYYKIRNRGDLRSTIEYLDKIFKTGVIDSTYNAEEWWNTSANGVDEIKVLQRSLLSRVDAAVNSIYLKEKTEQKETIIFLVIAILAVIAIVVSTIGAITKMLTELKVATQKISKGATGVSLHVESRDVIGELANSVLEIDATNKRLADAAEAIGKGNFDVVVTLRSDEDILGSSIKRMKHDLREFTKESRDKIWIHTGLKAVNESIAGEKDVNTLSNDALNALATYINCEVALFYLVQNQVLEFAAGYAVPDKQTVPLKINLGETLIGQAALKKKIMVLQDVPDDYISIKSGTGNAKPKHIALVPLVHNGILEGIIEVGSFNEIKQVTVSLFEQVTSVIAIALESAKSRTRLKELLEQTQAQTEELQQQRNELENLNTELEAQTQKLQASEEELKVQHEELLQANQELEEHSRLVEERNQVIVERNIEIQQKAKELEASTKYKSEFLANMSHELRTPLNSILLLSRLLAENDQHNLTDEQVEFAKVIQSSGNGLLSLIDEILDLSKIEAGKMELEFSDVTISSIASDLRSLFTPVAKERNLEFNITIDPNTPFTIETDKMRLEQVLKNLISNALKFTPKGSVELRIAEWSENTSFISFSVKDTGIGIAKDKQQVIFEAFRQEDGSTRRRFGGTGLGLSISRELTKLLGGEIKVSSEQGKGSEFIVCIPKVKPVENENDKAVDEPFFEEIKELPLPQEKLQPINPLPVPSNVPDDRDNITASDQVILIIEDDTSFAKTLLNFTHKKGYKGVVAVRGDEGLVLAEQFKPLGILLDIQLPVKDGWEVMQELKNNPRTRHIPVHIMSATEVKKESIQKGAVDFINKPVALEQMQEIFKKIEHVINRQGNKVLIVEENSKHAKALAYFLETFNVTAEISNNITQGVSALKREDVDCVILDMGIPDTNAYATLEAIKKNPGLENLPIIIFTGKSLSKAEEQKIKQYTDSIVIKTAFSYQRILDEVSLFLHLVEENKKPEKQNGKYRKLGALSEVLNNKTILIADDDVRNIFSLTKALEQHNMNVLAAMDGKEALRMLEENDNVDIVLMDIMMPEMDGFETTKRIRANFKYKNLPVIAVTAKTMTGDREKCIQAGASDYISKPVDIDQLLSLLRVWLYE